MNRMYTLLKGFVVFISLTLVMTSCYSTSTINSSSVDSQYNIDHKTMSIGDSSFLKNDTLWVQRDLTGDGIHTRKVIYRDHSRLAKITASGSGKIFVNVCIDRRGVPAFVRIDDRTTIESKKTQEQALKMISGYRFEAKEQAPEFQCGMIKLFLDIDAFK